MKLSLQALACLRVAALGAHAAPAGRANVPAVGEGLRSFRFANAIAGVDDLVRTYGDAYPEGRKWLAELSRWQREAAAGGESVDVAAATAAGGDIVLVRPGNYNEHLTIDKPVTLRPPAPAGPPSASRERSETKRA